MTPRQAEDRDAGRQAINEPCAHFADDLAYYKSSEFDGASCRQRFIDPFFAALGWDVADEDERGPFADVILDYSLKPSEAHRFPRGPTYIRSARIRPRRRDLAIPGAPASGGDYAELADRRDAASEALPAGPL